MKTDHLMQPPGSIGSNQHDIFTADIGAVITGVERSIDLLSRAGAIVIGHFKNKTADTLYPVGIVSREHFVFGTFDIQFQNIDRTPATALHDRWDCPRLQS